MSSEAIKEHLEALKPYLTSWQFIIVGLLAVWYVTASIKIHQIKKRAGAKEAPIFPSSFFGIPLLINLLKTKDEGRMAEVADENFDAVGSDTYVIKLATVPAVITRDPENIKAMLTTQFDDFALGSRHAHFKPLLGDGIFTLDGEGWRNSRLMLRPNFAREQVAHVKQLEPHVLTLAKHIEKARGNSFDLQELFFRLTVDTSTEFLFGESAYCLRDGTVDEPTPPPFDGREGFDEAFNISQAYLSSRSYSQMFYFLINNKEFRDTTAHVHKFARYYVDNALNTSQEDLEKKSNSGYVFLYELIKQTRNAKILQDQLLNVMIAGRDTTAGLLSFTFYELARNPEIYEKLKKEIYENFGDGNNPRVEDITFESLKRCEYLKFVLNEVLRMYPSVPINFRVATKRTTLPKGGGPDGESPIYVGKGTTVGYTIISTHRQEKYYGKDANVFRPERWADMKKIGWAYLPFNGGPRICLGQQFALTEASYVVVRLTQMFPNLVSKDEGAYPPKKNIQLTMSHKNGVNVSMSR